MPLYEIKKNELVPFKRLRAGENLYESQIEDLLWENPDEFLGESLFRVARQKSLPRRGIPDVVALDERGRVVVIEIKRSVERGQLAQCLEYAGWAKTASLDELAGMYHGGEGQFFDEWQTFTDSPTPTVINRSPRLVLVAHSFHGRTEQALDFLIDNGLPVTLVKVTIYEDADGRQFVDVEGEFEPVIDAGPDTNGAPFTLNGQRVRLGDLVEAGYLDPGDTLTWERPKLGELYQAVILENGSIHLKDGGAYASPSRAAVEAAGIAAYDGWWAWKVDRLDGEALKDVRARYIADRTNSSTSG